VSRNSLRLVHHHAGYLRVAADVFVGAETKHSAVDAVRAAAEGIDGFCRFSHNPKTGSIVVEYEPGAIDVDDLLKDIGKRAELDGVVIDVGRKIRRKELVGGIIDAFESVNGIVAEATGDRADLRELAPAALVAVSVVSFVLNEKRGRLPTWDSALYHSYRIFMNWHRKEIRDEEKH
jgi:hypothetical protein